MKIVFILPNIEVSGGARAVFEFANHLQSRWHDVTVVYPDIPVYFLRKYGIFTGMAARAYKWLGRIKAHRHLDWFDLKARLRRVATLEEKYIPDADIVVATWWETAHWVSRYSPSKGEKFYLAQHYEIWGGLEKAVDDSYRLGLKIIVNSTWLKNILQDRLNVKTEALILHAPDLEQFYPEKEKPVSRQVRVLMPYRRNISWKGVDDGVEAFNIAKKKFPDIHLVMFGPQRGSNVPDFAEFHLMPSNDALRNIYNSSDILLFPSTCEGFGMPPMEAMACGCAVVTTDVGAVPDYAIAGETALVSPASDSQALANNLIKLVENEPLRKKIAKAGFAHIVDNFSWAKATEELEAVFKKSFEARK